MSLLDKIKSTTKETASTIGAKSAELVETGKMKFNMAQLESEIKTKKKEIGDLVYAAHKMDEEVDAEKLTRIFYEIEEMENKIEELA
ncbi:MAG: hypothetical protein JJE29_04450 [Peptostreptococcaceae bacterium]|nr:hypothetical protein [Peptostreptococcaceae bacterium]